MLGFLSFLLTAPVGAAPTAPSPPTMGAMSSSLTSLTADGLVSAAAATPAAISFSGDQPMTLQQLDVEITGVQLTLAGLAPITQAADDSHLNEAGFGVQVRSANNGIVAVNQVASSVQARVITQGLGR